MVFSFLQAAFISYNRSRNVPVDEAPVLYSAETYDIDKLDRCDLYVVGIFNPRGAKRYSQGRQGSSIIDNLTFNTEWAGKMFGQYDTPVLMLFEAFPLAISYHNGCYVTPFSFSKSLYWCPASPHRTRGFILCGFDNDYHIQLGCYDNSLRDYFIDLFFFSAYRNKMIFPVVDKRVLYTWELIMDVRIKCGGVVPIPFFDLFYDGSFLFFDKDKYSLYTGNSLGYDDFDLMSALTKLRSRIDENGFVKESTFLLVSGFTRIDLESMLFRGILKLKTISGERYVSSFYWRAHDFVVPVQEFNFSQMFERDNDVLLLDDGSVFGSISKPVLNIIPVNCSYNSFVDNIGGAYGVTNILTMFK